MNISGPAAVAKPEMLFYAPGDLTVTKYRNSWNWRYHLSNKIDEVTLLLLMLLPSGSIDFTGFSIKGNKSNKKIEK